MERNELKKIFGAIFEEFIELNRLLKFGQSLFLYRKNEEVKEGVEKAFKIIKQEFRNLRNSCSMPNKRNTDTCKFDIV